MGSDEDEILTRDFEEFKSTPFTISSAPSPLPILSFEPVVRPVSTSPAKLILGEERNLTALHAAHIRDDPIEFGKQLAAWTSGTGWRAYQDYIGARIMYDGYSTANIKRILTSQAVTTKIRQLSLARLNDIEGVRELSDEERAKKLRVLERQLNEMAFKAADSMVAKMDSIPFLRFFGATVNNVLVRMYDQGIHIDLKQLAKFREIALHAEKKKQSLLLLPCHKSHIDYLTLSWACYRLGISLPHIVAGENLNMPVVGSWLQKCGAFYIRRSFGDDALYPVMVKEYIHDMLETGKNIECFTEGTRSRTGKLLPPKLGILKYVLEAMAEKRIEDVWICPISLQYDRVIETGSYASELLGTPKAKETLSGLLGSTSLLNLKMGRIDIRFKEPFSLAGYIAEQAVQRKGSKRPQQTVLLRALGYRVLSDINSVAVIMPAALVGTVLLTIRGRGVGRNELVRRVNGLIAKIKERGGKVANFDGMEIEEVVEKALVVIKNLVSTQTDLIEPTYSPSDRFQLSFYRNQTLHLFVTDAILSVALYTKVKAGGAAPSQRMTRSAAIDEISFVSSLLKNEFIYGTEGLHANANSTIARFEKDQIITVEGDLLGLSARERATGRENFDFYCFLLWPFVETYFLAAVSLFALTPLDSKLASSDNVSWFAEKDFHVASQLFGKTLYSQGDVSYLESINSATLGNAFARMVEIGVIITKKSSAPKPIPLMALHPLWVPQRTSAGDIAPEGKLWEFLARLGTFRREGKNRRDSSTVSTRVLSSVAAIAPKEVENTPFEGFEAPASDFWATKSNL